MKCNHAASHWVWQDDPWHPDGGEEVLVSEDTVQDLDLHRYQCTQCGEIMYYSGRARDYYERGILSPGVPGLDK
jgi:hypothetical protein